MEKIAEFIGNPNADADDEGEGKHATGSLFEELKGYCIQLLELFQNPSKKSSTPSQLLQLLQRSQPDALQPFLDYTLFPLLLLLDAAVNSRSSSKVDSEERSLISATPQALKDVSDAVAEGIVCCLEELLKKCSLGSVEQMIVILKKLTCGALLSPSEASEEFRVGVIRCFKALMHNLHVCNDDSCACKQISGRLMLLPEEKIQSPADKVLKYGSAQQECLLAFLQSETASAAIGHWLSLLLKAADVETGRGHRGSAALRVEAFNTLRVLTAKVAVVDALAFFLPGVVSQIGKVLHVSKTMISGAAGSTEALDQAIRGLAEFLAIVLSDDANASNIDISFDVSDSYPKRVESAVSFLEELRHLPNKGHDQRELVPKVDDVIDKTTPATAFKDNRNTNTGAMARALRVSRTKDWISSTSANVDKMLSATFPQLCIHPSKKVREGLLAAIEALLSRCSGTLKQSRLMFLECLCVLVCDDSGDVSSAAQVFLRCLFSSPEKKHYIEHDVAEIFNRLIEKLPKILWEDEESVAVSHVQKLLVLIYLSGPKLVADHLLQSPVTAARFLDLFALCLGHNSVFAGSLDKLVVVRPQTGYVRSIAEMNSVMSMNSEGSEFSDVCNKKLVHLSDNVQHGYELPHMPPWFVHVRNKRLYEALAGILRLVGLSVFADSRSEGSLSVIIDIPLGYMHNLVSEVRLKGQSKESWHSWYSRIGSGQLVRQASTAACILNEIIFGFSDQAIITSSRMFQKTEGDIRNSEFEPSILEESVWKICQKEGARSHLIECIGNILHEYLSSEVWDLPVENTNSHQQSVFENREMPLHFFHDNAMLHQVIIDGIGIFSLSLGQEFSSNGFLHSSLFTLLQNVICSNFQIRSASDAVLHIISTIHDYPTVGHLVLANSDYIIDSMCRQLRHLELNPRIPTVLASLLSYVGIAQKILPLLEEPMRAVSMELEILGRYQHPDLTIPFLKAVAEITKASKHESYALPNQAESFCEDVKSRKVDIKRETRIHPGSPESHRGFSTMEYMELGTEMEIHASGADMQLEQWETILLKLKDSKRYRRTVGSLIGSCLIAATPMLASADHAACLIALDIIEDGILALAKVEEAYKHEKETKEAIEEVFHLCSWHYLTDTLDEAEDETVENRMLPAINKIWPFLIACVRHKHPVAVRRCLSAISNVVQICGGDFFSRRFHADWIHFWRLLSTSPFHGKPILKEERTSLRLPYRSSGAFPEDSFAEVSHLKVQVAVLNLIADIARNRKSASALEVVLKRVAGIVVGIACSGVRGLQEASMEALKGLSSIDPDLIWLLVADVYYSLKKQNKLRPPTQEFPDISRILPPPLSSKGYLYVLYGEQSYGFDIDLTSVENVFKIFNSEGFIS